MKQLITKDRLIRDLDMYITKRDSICKILSCGLIGFLLLGDFGLYLDILNGLVGWILYIIGMAASILIIYYRDTKMKKECIKQINLGYIDCQKGTFLELDLNEGDPDLYWNFCLANGTEIWVNTDRYVKIPKKPFQDYWIFTLSVGKNKPPIYMLYAADECNISSQITRI